MALGAEVLFGLLTAIQRRRNFSLSGSEIDHREGDFSKHHTTNSARGEFGAPSRQLKAKNYLLKRSCHLVADAVTSHRVEVFGPSPWRTPSSYSQGHYWKHSVDMRQFATKANASLLGNLDRRPGSSYIIVRRVWSVGDVKSRIQDGAVGANFELVPASKSLRFLNRFGSFEWDEILKKITTFKAAGNQ
ncbi:hypothetical protein VNO77_38850 [Canavalia gladiata]|uniref:Uncharacterized protein n=1 Tax=Canavalia gladiata TaxID=3824 RepID=A0AAN9K9C7_CANGL